MGVKISNLPTASETQSTDIIPIVQEGTTKKIQQSVLFNNLNTSIDNLNNDVENIDNRLEEAIAEFTEPLTYKGEVPTYQDLPQNAERGDIYSVANENKNYIWDGTQWVVYSATIDLTEFENQIKTTIITEEAEEQEITNVAGVNGKIDVSGNSVQETGENKPSPDYPSEIRNCGDNVNLLNFPTNFTETDSKAITYASKNNILTISGTATGAGGKTINLTSNYTIKSGDYFHINSDGINGSLQITLKFSDTTEYMVGTIASLIISLDSYIGKTITGIQFYHNASYSDTRKLTLMIKNGISIMTPYSPYNCGNTNIELSNANIFNKETMAFTRRVMQDDESVINTSNPGVASSGKISLKAGTYSFYAKNLVDWAFYIQAYKNGTRVTQFPVGGNAKGHVFTLDDDYDIHLQLNSAAGSGVNVDSYLPTINDRAFLLKGNITTEPDYIAHQEQLITFPFIEGQRLMLGDYLADDGIHHKRKQVVFNGSEDWKLWNLSGATNVQRFYLENLTQGKSNGCMSDYFKYDGVNYDDYVHIYIGGASKTDLYIYIPRTIATTVEALKTWLSNNPITVEYELATEEIESYTPEQAEAYWQLQHALMYEDYTKIECIDEIKCKFKVQYSYNNEINTYYGQKIDNLEDSVHQLEKQANSDIYSTYEITDTPQHSLGTNSYQLAKFNKFVNLNMGVLWFNSITANAWFSIGTLPNIICPSKGMCSIGVIMDGVGQIVGYARIEIETSGNIRIKPNVTINSLSGVSFCVSWFI